MAFDGCFNMQPGEPRPWHEPVLDTLHFCWGKHNSSIMQAATEHSEHIEHMDTHRAQGTQHTRWRRIGVLYMGVLARVHRSWLAVFTWQLLLYLLCRNGLSPLEAWDAISACSAILCRQHFFAPRLCCVWKFPKPSQLCYLLSTASPLLEWICMGRQGYGGVWRWSGLRLTLHQHLHTLGLEFYRLSGLSSSHSCRWSLRAGSIYAALNTCILVTFNKYFLSPEQRAAELNTGLKGIQIILVQLECKFLVLVHFSGMVGHLLASAAWRHL